MSDASDILDRADEADGLYSPSASSMPEIPELSWDDAMSEMNWRQAEHVTIIGPTGLGKTELITSLLTHRKYVVFLGTKNKDNTQDVLARQGYRLIREAKALEPEIASKYIVRPGHPRKASADSIKQLHQQVFREVLMRAYRQGGWTVVADELRYLTGFLGLNDEFLLMWLQGRSEDISVVSGTQRPRYVPLEAYDQPTHLFFFRDSDLGNVRRVAELVSVHREAVEMTVPNLPEHDVLYVNTRDGNMFITNTRK